MTIHPLRNIVLAIALVIGVAACGDGTQLAGGGIGGTGISQGPITGFGSIWVNGVEFDTATAAIIKEGATVTQNALKLGMVVTVDGSIDSNTSGTAATVTYTKELEGPISSITLPSTLMVLGQTVIVDNLTKIEKPGITSPTLSALSSGETVEVSGFPAANGAFRATYIEVKSAGNADVEVKGVITAMGSGTITLGALTVDITMIAPAVTVQQGDYVKVKGTLSGVGTTLVASTLEKKSRGLGTDNKDKAELQGYVTDFTSTGDFVVDAQRVQTGQATRYRGGSAAAIKTGVRLEVEGALANGILLATKVTFEDDLSLEGNVASVNGNTITLGTYPDITIEINEALTEGAARPHDIGAYVKIRGRKLDTPCATNTCLLATELESAAASGTTAAELRGPVTAIDAAARIVTVLGVQLDTGTIPDSGFSGAGITGRDSFFNTVRVGDLVVVNGIRSGGAITWQAIELED